MTFVLVVGSSSRLPAASADEAGAVPASLTPTDLELALEAYGEGRFGDARRLFLRAHEAAPTARTLRGLGVVSYALGEYDEAILLLEAAMDHPLRPLDDELRALVVRLLADAQLRVARVRLTAIPTSAELRVDGRVVLPSAAERGIPLMPGIHEFVARAPGYVDVVVAYESRAGVEEDVRLELFASPPPGPALSVERELPDPPAEPSPIDRDATDSGPRRLRLGRALMISGAGTLLAGLGIIGVTAARYRDVEDECRLGCTSERVDELYAEGRIDALRSGSWTVSAIATVAIASGVAVFVTGSPDRPSPRVAFRVSPRSLGFTGAF